MAAAVAAAAARRLARGTQAAGRAAWVAAAARPSCSAAAQGAALSPSVGYDYAARARALALARAALPAGARTRLPAARKLLLSHALEPQAAAALPPGAYARLRVGRLALQDATAQMAMLQVLAAGVRRAALPTSVHCDHLIAATQAEGGAEADLGRALEANREVYEFLRTASARLGAELWLPGAGIIHQTVLERYALPGMLLAGTDSHTPNAGGMGAFAVGVGGADAVDVMAGVGLELPLPRVVGVRLTGALRGWTAPKDVALYVAGELGVRGAAGAVLEYHGPGIESISATGQATITNMGAELGATTSLFPFNARQAQYLRSTRREAAAKAAEQAARELLWPDEGATYDHVIKVDLSALEPHINGPFSPDRAHTLSEFAAVAEANDWPALSAGLIGSCTNSSFEDLQRSASVARQFAARGAARSAKALLLAPGSEQISRTARRDGLLADFEAVGGELLASACGPCCGQWQRGKGEAKPLNPNSVLCSFNRNFTSRLDGNPNTHAFLASPELVTAITLAGRLTFNPETDTLVGADGKQFMLDPPEGDALPAEGFASDADAGLRVPPDKNAVGRAEVAVDPSSQRLQLLEPFVPWWDGTDLESARVLIKAKGKCTTDHISMAGPWLKYRGHLDNISNNLLIGATNAENGKINSVYNALDGTEGAVPDVARAYKAAGVPWVVVGDENYGEGSSREHAALEPRHLGGRAVIAKSFARIHETNLKKQGMLPLTFANAEDYEKVGSRDEIAIQGLADITPGVPLTVQGMRPDGETYAFAVNHTFTLAQLEWLRTGSALNALANASAA